MQNAKKEALALSQYFLSLPHPAKTALMILAVSFLFGVLFGIAKPFEQNPAQLFLHGIDGFFLLALPAFLSSLVLTATRRKAVLRRSLFLALLTAIAYGIFYLLSFLLAPFWSQAGNLIFLGFGVAFVLWYFLLLFAFDFRKSALLFALLQAVFFALAYLVSTGAGINADASDMLAKIFLSGFVFLAALYALLFIVSAPMKKNLGVSGGDAISMFLSQWLYGEKDLEEAFEWIGENVETLVWAGRFSGRRETLFIVPYIHFGPFGNLGGSEFTSMISEALSDNGRRNVFVFHGTATHDFNPVSSGDIGSVIAACRHALSNTRLSSAKLSVLKSKAGSVTASALKVGNSAFLTYTRAPETTEDINLGLGLALMEKAKKYCNSACVVDAHNAETGDISSVEVGSPIGFEMLDATENLFKKPSAALPFLFASSSCPISLDTIGKNGVKLALFSRGKKLDALLLIDCNGVVPPFRDELVSFLSSLGKEKGFTCSGEVLTTDTHQINNVQGVLRPLGSGSRAEVIAAVRKLFTEAISHLEPVKFGCAEERFSIKVFGSGQSVEIASTINAAVAVLRLTLPLILLASAVVLMWALSKI